VGFDASMLEFSLLLIRPAGTCHAPTFSGQGLRKSSGAEAQAETE